MNDTRLDWTRYHCNKEKQKNYTVLSLSGFFGFLTFIYYAAVRKHEKYKNKIFARMSSCFLLVTHLLATTSGNLYWLVPVKN